MKTEKNFCKQEKTETKNLKRQVDKISKINRLTEEAIKIKTKELSDEKSRLLSSINSLSFGFIIVSMDNNIVLSNSSLLKILDIDKTPATISELAKLFKDFDFVNSYKECVETQETVEIKEIIFSNKFLKISYSPIVNVNKIIDYVVIIEDITEAKIIERSKDDFFSLASHELRTPLTAIRGNADMILDMYGNQIPNADIIEMLTDIDIASVRLIDIINDFLEVSRLEQGKVKIRIEEFELTRVINKCIKNLKLMADKKNISLVYSAPKIILPKVLADQGHTEKILINLIANAIKFTNSGSIIITTEVKKQFMTIKIIDTGIGIEKINQPLLFKKFQQAGRQYLARADTSGTGLGLYISKLLVQSMGGNIWLEQSAPGLGSTFVFTLPIVV